MKLREIVLLSALGASALMSCKQKSAEMLEPIAVAWSTGPCANYTTLKDAREAVYRSADTNNDGSLSLREAKAMVERCPESNRYNCN